MKILYNLHLYTSVYRLRTLSQQYKHKFILSQCSIIVLETTFGSYSNFFCLFTGKKIHLLLFACMDLCVHVFECEERDGKHKQRHRHIIQHSLQQLIHEYSRVHKTMNVLFTSTEQYVLQVHFY